MLEFYNPLNVRMVYGLVQKEMGRCQWHRQVSPHDTQHMAITRALDQWRSYRQV